MTEQTPTTAEELTEQERNWLRQRREFVDKHAPEGRIKGSQAGKQRAASHHRIWLREAQRIYSESPHFLKLPDIALEVVLWCSANGIKMGNGSYRTTTIYKFLSREENRIIIYATPKKSQDQNRW